MKEVEKQVSEISDFLILNGQNTSSEELKKDQLEFKKMTNQIFEKSYFFNRARTWPRGYAGDFETLEKIYGGVPVAKDGIGMYLDNYFVTRTLAKGVRERKRLLGNLIITELEQREIGQRILNIACGSSREVFDIGKKINVFKPQITFLDYDKGAVDYSKLLLSNEGIHVDEFKFMKYNALNLVFQEETRAEFGERDIIYSAGLFDYIKTDVLIKMIASLYSLLADGGVLIAPFKDKENYTVFDYHWLTDWSYFFQRTIEEVTNILEEATNAKIEIIKSESEAINFFIIRKN